MPVVRVNLARAAIGPHRALAIIQLFGDLAQREPGRGVAGHKFQGLFEQVGCARKIALGLAIARPFEAAIRDQVAGGEEQAGKRLQKDLDVGENRPSVVVQKSPCSPQRVR